MTPAGVVLAAGEGRRLRPLTSLRPKPLCPIGSTTLLDLALDRIGSVCGSGPDAVAVNAHHLANQLVAAVGVRAHPVVEPELLGTAGALGNLRGWLDSRDVLLTNGDAFLGGQDVAIDLTGLVRGASDRPRLLVTPPAAGQRADFVDPDGLGWRYVGACWLPWRLVRDLRPEPSGLYEVMWRDCHSQGELDLVPLSALAPAGVAIDCGTPADYLAANLLISGGTSVVGPSATMLGQVHECVIWDGAYVGPEESLVRVIRAGTREHPVTVAA